MLTTHTYEGSQPVTWIDITDATRADVLAIAAEYRLPLEITEELLVPSSRSRIRSGDNCLFLALHFPALVDSAETRNEQEIDCIIGDNFLITAHAGAVDSILEFEKTFDAAKASPNYPRFTGLSILHELLSLFYANVTTQLNDISDTLKKIEDRVFSGEEDRMVQVISKTNRKLMDHRRSLQFHEIVLEDALEEGTRIFGNEANETLLQLVSAFRSVSFLIANNKAILDDLRDTNDLLLNTKTNHIMKMLTLITFITIPIVVGVEILRHPLESIEHTPASMAMVIVGVILVSAALITFFRYKRWF